MKNNNWKNSTCTCLDWLKNYKSSHTIAVAYRLNLIYHQSNQKIKKSKSTLLNDSLDDIDDDLKVKDTQITFPMSFKDGPGDLAKSGAPDI
ncbi:hypothetical protein BpHYR1_002742 [Brachionus plicatilis]|uniref:Uncharacterized protein n=1 Tax=Brachionus plicatilis TaxID=10195 RepID=A0A3M7PKM3_BRAPC|nr:hypothetical protein BpHYR1_002742 [Brachionus plicatilis]